MQRRVGRSGGNFSAILLGIFLLILAWAPLPLGSNRAWSWSLLEAGLLGIAGCLLVAGIVNPRALLHNLRPFLLPCSLFLVWILYQILMLLPLPLDTLATVSEAKAAWYTATGNSAGYLTAYYHGSQAVLLKNLCYFLAFMAALVLFDSRGKIVVAVVVMVVVGLFESFYGLAVYHMNDDFPWWRPTWYGHHWVSGTFINRNHYAAHLSFSLALVLSIAIVHFEVANGRSEKRGLRQKFLLVTDLLESRSVLLLIPFGILLYGFLAAQSRGALLALLCAFVVVGLARGKKALRSLVEIRMAAFFAMAAVISGLLLGVMGIFSRLVNLAQGVDFRWELWKQSLTLLRDHWVLGTGNGTFEFVFPRYKLPPLTENLFDYAHNDWLQLLIEQGAIGFCLFASLIFTAVRRILLAYHRSSSSSSYQGLLLGVLVALVAFVLHGLVDFNFHIPANALWFYTLLAMGLRLAAMKNASDAGRSKRIANGSALR